MISYIITAEGRLTPKEETFEYEYYLTDHLGNTRVVFNENNQVLQTNSYYPFGMNIESLTTNNQTLSTKNLYLYNGKELQTDFGLDLLDYGARFYDAQIGRWHVQDAFSEKYLNLSSYQYAANNPILNIDVNGDSLWITSNKGFLGLGGQQTLLYENGVLYNKDETKYTGKTRGFLKKTTKSLKIINGTSEGKDMITELQNSNNNFEIKKGASRFAEDNMYKAYANQLKTDPTLKALYDKKKSEGIDFTGGSGGIIYWSGYGTTLPTVNGSGKNKTTDLGHELFHGLDANRGLIDDRVYEGIKRSEWQAVYRENNLRSQLGFPLRTHYGHKENGYGEFLGPIGKRMITPSNKPIKPSWYK